MKKMDYKQQQRVWANRRKLAATLAGRGYSWAQIGRMLNPPCSRQRVGQLLAANAESVAK